MFELPKLNYKYSDLEPYIDSTTMEIHYTKHHQAYVDNLNKALDGQTALQKLSLEELLSDTSSVPENIRQAVINNGGGHYNHSFFWSIMAPGKKVLKDGEFKKALEKSFGSLETLREKFSEKAMGVFGSGWAFLILDKDRNLALKRHSFQNSPVMNGNIPIIGIDVWEHAYYLKYQNKRKDYVDAWWNTINWDKAEELFKAQK